MEKPIISTAIPLLSALNEMQISCISFSMKITSENFCMSDAFSFKIAKAAIFSWASFIFDHLLTDEDGEEKHSTIIRT